MTTGYFNLPGFEPPPAAVEALVVPNVEAAGVEEGTRKGVLRRAVTPDEDAAIRCLGEQVGYSPGTWDKKFAGEIYGRRGSGMISEKEAAQVWRMFRRYRRQIQHVEKERLLEVAALHAATEARKGN